MERPKEQPKISEASSLIELGESEKIIIHYLAK